MPWVETEFDDEFKQWIYDFPKDQLPKIKGLLKKYAANKNVVVFTTRDETKKYLEKSVM